MNSPLFHTLSSGVLFVEDPTTGEWLPGGSCAAIGNRAHWLTAGHCVPLERRVVLVRGGLRDHQLPALQILRHPEADIAIVRVALDDDDSPAGLENNFYRVPENVLALGSDFIGSAYPIGNDGQPVERTLKGYFQRIIWGYSPAIGSADYNAFEMSIPALRGSSGATLAYAHEPMTAAAIVTENQASYITVSSFEEVADSEGRSYRELHQEVVSYGIAVALVGYRDWLAEVTA